MFIGRHGSLNGAQHRGHEVVFVSFDKDKPAGIFKDVLVGLLSPRGDAYGRPVGVAHSAKPVNLELPADVLRAYRATLRPVRAGVALLI